MSFGQIPGGNLQTYYKMDDATDSSGNGFDLTNTASVTFGVGKFGGAADYGGSGTTKSLNYATAKVFSIENPLDVMVSFWFQLNSTADISERYFYSVTSRITAPNTGLTFSCSYQITAGVCTIKMYFARQAPLGVVSCSFTWTPDTNWHYIQSFITANNAMTVIMDRDQTKRGFLGTISSSDESPTTGTLYLAIGNSRGGTLQVWAKIDDLFIEESLYAPSSAVSDRVKIYTQYRGMLV